MFQRHPIQNEVTMFITTNTRRRIPFFAEKGFAHETIETLYRVQGLHPFFLYGFVIMPDHCHFLIKVPHPGSVSKIMNIFKSGVSANIGKGPLWQSRFDLRIPKNAGRVLTYIHYNPVKAGLAKVPEEYPWSSASGRWDVTSLDSF